MNNKSKNMKCKGMILNEKVKLGFSNLVV